MHEIETSGQEDLYSLSILVGTGECNAYCKHCGGVPLRKYAPKEDGIIDRDLFEKILRECYDRGARYLSISGCGEPTLSPASVTATMDLVHMLAEEGIAYTPVNLYSNGIRIGNDSDFSNTYLGCWRQLGLTSVYLSVHDIDEARNAAGYGVTRYPKLENILSRIHDAGLLVRINLILSKENTPTCDDFTRMISALREMGADTISAWPIRGLNDLISPELAPSEQELGRMAEWVMRNEDPNFKIRLLIEKGHDSYAKRKKLTLFPDGKLASFWCN